ncbi:short-chain dehydrogenase [Rouxiella silvae]|uniref:Short-chain dehydrogenase n=1 Tax=Rouxiella silvae TaxID=1646373 RepID=A0ABX3TZP4_9GAMM|nr:SDR family NAD(P)-dependent oxidoreductase [Rouxiella silvae]ORJ20700.1 short-chain dehydrogenase [Rouxiella silvae]
MKLCTRTILITGGSSGIGLELAGQLIAAGNTVLITGRSEQALQRAKGRFPELHIFQSDVSKAEDIRSLHEQVAAHYPKLDTLINNAGVMKIVPLQDPRTLEALTQEVDINLKGAMRMVQQFLPLLKSQSDALIVNVSSGLAFVPFAVSPVYSAAKAGMHAYTRCLRAQLLGTKIRVAELAPPLTETPLFSAEFKGKMKGEKGMPVDVLVRKALAAIEAGKCEICPGQSNILRIASRLAPGFIFRQLSKVV